MALDRRLGAALVAAVVTLVAVVGLWVLRAGGGAEPDRLAPGRARHTGEDGPVIGALMRTVADRLASNAPPTAPLRGPLRFRAARVRIEAPGRDFLTADVVTGTLETNALRTGDIIISDLTATGASVAMQQSATGDWNYEIPLARLLEDDDDDDGSDRTIAIRRLRVIDGSADIVMPERTVTARTIQLDIRSVQLAGPELPEPRMHVAIGTADITGLLPSRPDSTLPVRVEEAELRFPEATVAFDAERAIIGNAAVTRVAGVWDPGGPGYGIDVTGTAADARLADLRFIAPDRIPEEGSADFRFAVESLPDGDTQIRLFDLTASTNGSQATGSLTFVFGEERAALPEADLTVAPLSIALLEQFGARDFPIRGDLTGTVRGTGGDIRFDLAAALVLESSGDAFEGTLTGMMAFAPDGGMRVNLDAGADLGGGRVTATGQVAMEGGTTTYDLTGTVTAVDASVLTARAPPVLVGARFTLRGSGVSPDSAQAQLVATGGFSGWESEPGDTIAVALAVDRGLLSVSQLDLRLAGFETEAAGNWRFVEPRSGRVAYDATFTTLDAWGPYLPVIGDTAAVGTLALRGTISGTLDDLQLDGGLTAQDVQSGGWSVGELTATYAARTGMRMTFDVRGTGSALGTPTEGVFEDVAFSFAQSPPSLAVQVDASATDGRVIRIVADGVVPDSGATTAMLRELRLDVAGGQWTLAAPASVQWGGGRVDVVALRIQDARASGRFAIDGRVWPLEESDATLEIVDLPLEDVQRLANVDPIVTGMLSAQGRISGSTTAPVVELTYGLADGAVRGVALSSLSGEVNLAGNVLDIVAAARFAADTAGALDLRARLPVEARLSSDPAFRVLDSGVVDGELVATTLSLASFAALSPSVRDVTGVLDGRVTLTGTADAPELGGGLTVSGGAMTIPALNQRYTDIVADLALIGRRLVVNRAEAHSGGALTIAGDVTFETISDPTFELLAYLDGFRPVGVSDRTDAAVSGRMSIAGGLDAPVLSGQLAVSDGYVTIPQFGATAAFEDLGVAAPVIGQDLAAAPGGGLMGRLRIEDLSVQVGEGVWFVAEEARAQLAGELTVNKSGESMRIQGTLAGERGTYTLRAGPVIRRFDVLDAEVRFLGSPDIDPALAITARRFVFDETGRQIEVVVTIGGSLRRPTLALASADLANIPESELLSFLLFGRPTLELAGGGLPGETLLESTFLELATLELEQAIVGDLGVALDIFQVRFPGGVRGAAAPTVLVGRELATDVFLTVESGLAALFGSEAEAGDSWAIRLEWAFDRNSSARVGWEPVTRTRFLRGLGAALPARTRAQQLFLELRRRWTY